LITARLLYQPEFSKYPLMWIWETAWKLDEKFYEVRPFCRSSAAHADRIFFFRRVQIHCGPDATVYLRFLRGSCKLLPDPRRATTP
jgi:hypothetical protein